MDDVMQIAATLANARHPFGMFMRPIPKWVFVAELPNGTQYLFSKAGLFKLRKEGKLNVPGVEVSGVRKQPRV